MSHAGEVGVAQELLATHALLLLLMLADFWVQVTGVERAGARDDVDHGGRGRGAGGGGGARVDGRRLVEAVRQVRRRRHLRRRRRQLRKLRRRTALASAAETTQRQAAELAI